MTRKFLPYWMTPEIMKAAAVMAAMLFVVSYLVDLTLMRLDVPPSSTILNDIAIAMIATGVMLFYLFVTHTQNIFLRAKERMNLTAELNFHLSRALLEFRSAAEVEDRDQRLRMLDQATEYIDHVLIELDGGGRHGYEFCVCTDMLFARHSHQCGCDSGRGTGKLQSAFGVAIEAQRFPDKFWKIAGHLALQEGSAGDQRDVQLFGGFHDGHTFSIDRLTAESERFGHSQIERQLNETEVMVVASDFFGNGIKFR